MGHNSWIDDVERIEYVQRPQTSRELAADAVNAKADDPACEHVHHHHEPVAAQEYRFAAEQIDAPNDSISAYSSQGAAISGGTGSDAISNAASRGVWT